MKRVILAALAVGMMLFCMCGIARAEEYSCEGGSNPVPATVSCDTLITEEGNCTISHSVESGGGYIQITAGGSITVEGDIKSATAFGATAGENLEVTGEVSVNRSGAGGNVLIYAGDESATGQINTNDNAASSAVQIHADTS